MAPEADGRAAAAEAWLVRLNGTPSAAERREFLAWRTDRANADAFAQAEALWRRVDPAARRLAARHHRALRPLLARAPSRAARFRRACLSAGGAAVAALLLVGVAWVEWPGTMAGLVADVSTGRGERRLVQLPDGSTVLLDADSAIGLDFDPTARRIVLLRGAGFFDVRPDAARPFTVVAAGGEVRAVGTAFAVDLLAGGGAAATVAEGVVDISVPAGGGWRLHADQAVRFGTAKPGEPQDVRAADVLTWRQGRLAFDRAPLVDVVAALNRYRPGRVAILDDALASRRVSGSFDAADPDAVLHSLQAILGFQRIDLTGRLVLLRSP